MTRSPREFFTDASRMFHSSGYGPVEDLSAAGYFPNFQRNFPAQTLERLPKPITGDAAADGIKLRY